MVIVADVKDFSGKDHRSPSLSVKFRTVSLELTWIDALGAYARAEGQRIRPRLSLNKSCNL